VGPKGSGETCHLPGHGARKGRPMEGSGFTLKWGGDLENRANKGTGTEQVTD
jgi:hypothetical protein